MSNIGIKFDLAKLVHVETTMTGRNGQPVSGMFVPYEANYVYVGEKGRYLDLTGVEAQNPRDDKSTHFIKTNLKKEVRDAMTDEQRKNQPILGNCWIWGGQYPAPAPTGGNGIQDAVIIEQTTGDLPF